MGGLLNVSERARSGVHRIPAEKKSGVCACGCPPGTKKQMHRGSKPWSWFREQRFLKATPADSEQTNYNSCLNRGNGTTCVPYVNVCRNVLWRKRDMCNTSVFLGEVGEAAAITWGMCLKWASGLQIRAHHPCGFQHTNSCVCVRAHACACACACVCFS